MTSPDILFYRNKKKISLNKKKKIYTSLSQFSSRSQRMEEYQNVTYTVRINIAVWKNNKS